MNKPRYKLVTITPEKRMHLKYKGRFINSDRPVYMQLDEDSGMGKSIVLDKHEIVIDKEEYYELLGENARMSEALKKIVESNVGITQHIKDLAKEAVQ